MSAPDIVAVMLDGLPFWHHRGTAGGLRFHWVQGGQGPVVVLLAGFPQSWYAWRRVMPLLARRHTVRGARAGADRMVLSSQDRQSSARFWHGRY